METATHGSKVFAWVMRLGKLRQQDRGEDKLSIHCLRLNAVASDKQNGFQHL